MKNFLYILSILLISLLLIKPLFQDGFFPIHDNTQISRVFEMKEALSDGMFPVRWVDNLGYGYGYPIFTYYAPLAYYIGGIITLVIGDAVVGTKVMIALGMVLAGVSMYYLSKEFWGSKGGFIAGVLYTFAPYHGVNLYVRGAIAELWAYAFIPLVFLGLWKIYKSQKWSSVVLTSLSFAGVILSHNLTAVMVLPFIFITVCVLMYLSFKKKKQNIIMIVIALLLGVCLAAFYWLPAIAQLSLTNVSSQISGTGTYYYEHFLCIPQLWSSPLGYAGSASGCIDGMTFQIGKLHIGIAVLGFVFAFLMRRRKEFYVVLFALVGLFLSVLLTLRVSEIFWNLVPPMSYIQFPWRFLSFIVFFSSFISGFIVFSFENYIKQQKIIWFGVLFFTVIALMYYGKFFIPQTIVTDVEKEAQPQYIREVVSRISDEYLPIDFARPQVGSTAGALFPSDEKVKADILEDKVGEKVAHIQNNSDTPYSMNLTYSPSWEVSAGDTVLKTFSNQGLLTFTLPKGDSVVKVIYKESFVEKIGDGLSIIGILLIGLGILLFKGNKKR